MKTSLCYSCFKTYSKRVVFSNAKGSSKKTLKKPKKQELRRLIEKKTQEHICFWVVFFVNLGISEYEFCFSVQADSLRKGRGEEVYIGGK